MVLPAEGRTTIPAAHENHLRYYRVPQLPYAGACVSGWHFGETLSIDTTWEVCTPDTAGRFSAIAYLFAKGLVADLGVPIGIVECVWGGTSAFLLDERGRPAGR